MSSASAAGHVVTYCASGLVLTAVLRQTFMTADSTAEAAAVLRSARNLVRSFLTLFLCWDDKAEVDR